jgi:hypothetical protein
MLVVMLFLILIGLIAMTETRRRWCDCGYNTALPGQRCLTCRKYGAVTPGSGVCPEVGFKVCSCGRNIYNSRVHSSCASCELELRYFYEQEAVYYLNNEYPEYDDYPDEFCPACCEPLHLCDNGSMCLNMEALAPYPYTDEDVDDLPF